MLGRQSPQFEVQLEDVRINGMSGKDKGGDGRHEGTDGGKELGWVGIQGGVG
jgi:hypothetical protein